MDNLAPRTESKQCPCHCRCCISDGCGASEHYPKDEYGELDGGI